VPGLPLSGGCLCGGVRFEVAEPPATAVWCHCTRCQRRTGTSSAASAALVPGSLRLLAGAELVRSYDPGDGGFLKEFCARCGGALWSRHPTDADRVSVRLGVFDGDPGVRPACRQYTAYAAAWDPIPDDGLPRYPERRPGP
jgi:hypothetical protein